MSDYLLRHWHLVVATVSDCDFYFCYGSCFGYANDVILQNGQTRPSDEIHVTLIDFGANFQNANDVKLANRNDANHSDGNHCDGSHYDVIHCADCVECRIENDGMGTCRRLIISLFRIVFEYIDVQSTIRTASSRKNIRQVSKELHSNACPQKPLYIPPKFR